MKPRPRTSKYVREDSASDVHGPYFFEDNVTGDNYLHMLQSWLMDRHAANKDEDFIFPQDGAPPHWKLSIRAYLNENLPVKCIRRAGSDDSVLLKRPPQSPDLTPCDSFVWSYVKGVVYVPSLPANLVELKQRITSALEIVKEDMLQRV